MHVLVIRRDVEQAELPRHSPAVDLNACKRVLAAFERQGGRYANVSVVSARALYDMKKNTVRLKERADSACEGGRSQGAAIRSARSGASLRKSLRLNV